MYVYFYALRVATDTEADIKTGEKCYSLMKAILLCRESAVNMLGAVLVKAPSMPSTMFWGFSDTMALDIYTRWRAWEWETYLRVHIH